MSRKLPFLTTAVSHAYPPPSKINGRTSCCQIFNFWLFQPMRFSELVNDRAKSRHFKPNGEDISVPSKNKKNLHMKSITVFPPSFLWPRHNKKSANFKRRVRSIVVFFLEFALDLEEVLLFFGKPAVRDLGNAGPLDSPHQILIVLLKTVPENPSNVLKKSDLLTLLRKIVVERYTKVYSENPTKTYIKKETDFLQAWTFSTEWIR